MLKEYIRDKKGNPIGFMLSENMAGIVAFGYSLCNKQDTYNKEKGMLIALNRLNDPRFFKYPSSVLDQYSVFVERSKRYFKDARVIETQGELDALNRG